MLRLCSVFEPDPATLTGRGNLFDPIGGIQNHTASLTRALDDVEQTVITSRLGGPTGAARLASRATVLRVGAPIRHPRPSVIPSTCGPAGSLCPPADGM
jgi:glycogen(starch) synthase